jgi:hypothetical protein
MISLDLLEKISEHLKLLKHLEHYDFFNTIYQTLLYTPLRRASYKGGEGGRIISDSTVLVGIDLGVCGHDDHLPQTLSFVVRLHTIIPY